MALVLNDRVRETTTTTGTGAVSLGGAVSGFETFAAGIGNSNTVYYAIVHRSAAEFEVGLGTLDGDSSDLTRTTPISSSNSDSAVDFSSGTKDVFCTLPASKAVFEDANNDVTIGRNLTVTGDLTITGDDITMNTNTSGAALIGDGTNFNPVAISGDITIAANGTAAIGSGVIVNADINSSAAIADSKLAAISTAGKVALSALEIDGGTDIGANLADADLFIVDDGAGGTNRKIEASRIATYVGASAGAFAIANLDIDGGTDIGADLVDADEIIVDDGGGGTNRRSDLERVKKYIFSAVSGDATASDAGALTIANTSVETAMIAADAITEAKIADDAVESEHINDNVISGQTALTSGLAGTDELLISDGGTVKKMDVTVLQDFLGDPTALAIALG